MVFLDTCIWIELCGVKTPEKEHEIRQAVVAGNLIKDIVENKTTIITCKEQLLEVIQSVQKSKMREFNNQAKKAGTRGVGDLKSFRKDPAYQSAKELCKQVVSDVIKFSKIEKSLDCSIDELLDKIHLADINDYIYYDFCKNYGVKLYTFDSDFDAIDSDGIVARI